MMGRILTLTMAVMAGASFQLYNRFYPNQPCTLDPPIELEGFGDKQKSWNACHVFSLEYSEARDKFRAAANQLGAEPSSLAIVMDDGSDDSPLTTDIAILRGSKPGVLVHSSATHGVEGYSGSAIQLALLQEGILSPPEDRPTIVLVHAVNPNGMKNYRRANERNVDLARNAIQDFETFLKDRDPNIANYDDFRYFTAPQWKPSALWDGTFGYWVVGIPALIRNGYPAMKRIFVSGQYHHPEGIFYGGTQREPSIQQLFDFVTSEERGILPREGDDFPLIWIDVHTGLGKFGMDTVQTEKSIPLSMFQKWFPSAYHLLTPLVEDRGSLGGYGSSNGSLTTFIHKATNGSALTVIQEFGTLPGVLMGRALILENAIHHYGDDEGRRTLGRAWLQAAFYPQSTAWRASIVKRGVSLALQSLDSIMEQSSEE